MQAHQLGNNRVATAQPLFRNVVEPRVAVLLNSHARKVTHRVIHSLTHVVPEDDLFVSTSELDCRRIVQTVLERNYSTAFLGGGDGTFMGFVNEFYRQLKQRRSVGLPQRPPRFGVLRLGTGNSIASVVRASPLKGDGILDDVLRTRANLVPGTRHLDLLEVEGKRAPFAGMGVDAQLLNDYLALKTTYGKGPFRSLLTGGRGYFSSIVLKTIPKCLAGAVWFDCEVVNGKKGPAYRLNPQGMPVGEPIGPGELIFRGRLNMAAAGTIPYYGYEFKMFPFAGTRRGMMHLRLAALSTSSILAHLPQLWKAKWFPEGLQDFHAEEVHVQFGKSMPLQVGGDAEGYREKLTLNMSPDPVELVDFTGAVN